MDYVRNRGTVGLVPLPNVHSLTVLTKVNGLVGDWALAVSQFATIPLIRRIQVQLSLSLIHI